MKERPSFMVHEMDGLHIPDTHASPITPVFPEECRSSLDLSEIS